MRAYRSKGECLRAEAQWVLGLGTDDHRADSTLETPDSRPPTLLPNIVDDLSANIFSRHRWPLKILNPARSLETRLRMMRSDANSLFRKTPRSSGKIPGTSAISGALDWICKPNVVLVSGV